MTDGFKDMLFLLRRALRGDKSELPVGLNYKKAGSAALSQQVMPLIFDDILSAYESGKFAADAAVINQMKTQIAATVVLGLQREKFLETVLKKFEESSIKCILLKGALLADLYPNPSLRISGDIDLYVKEKDEVAAIKILREAGFEVEPRMKNEYHSECHHKIIKSLELHVSLYEDYCSDLWFNSIAFDTDKTVRYTTKAGYSYTALDTNEQFLFNILHLIKHFLSSGVGIRQICDIMLFEEKNREKINEQRYKEAMKSLKFDYFMDCCNAIAVKYLGAKRENLIWINEKAVKSEDCEKILTDIEEGGIFGHNNPNRRGFSKAYTDAICKAKFSDGGAEYMSNRNKGTLVSRIFLNYDNMKKIYPYLKRGKWLLPFAWLHRGLRFVFGGKAEDKEKSAAATEHLELMRDMKIL